MNKIIPVQILPINTILKNDGIQKLLQTLGSNLTNKYNPQERTFQCSSYFNRSNLTNKYNPQELEMYSCIENLSSNLTNKYNPQEQEEKRYIENDGSNLTNKYNPQELNRPWSGSVLVQILPINTILKNQNVCYQML